MTVAGPAPRRLAVVRDDVRGDRSSPARSYYVPLEDVRPALDGARGVIALVGSDGERSVAVEDVAAKLTAQLVARTAANTRVCVIAFERAEPEDVFVRDDATARSVLRERARWRVGEGRVDDALAALSDVVSSDSAACFVVLGGLLVARRTPMLAVLVGEPERPSDWQARLVAAACDLRVAAVTDELIAGLAEIAVSQRR